MARIVPLNIDWKPDRASGKPVTEQIVDYMCEQVSSGNWPIGSRLPSQRALAEWSKGGGAVERESSATHGR